MSIQNGCALAAAWNYEKASQDVYFLLHAMQHKGSDGAGIAASDGHEIRLCKRLGMLSESLPLERLEELTGSAAIGQVRMACPDDIRYENLQPIMVRAHQGNFALVSCGMISNADSLRRRMEKEGLIFQGTSDAEIIAHLIQVSQGTLQEKIEKACQILKGPYVFVLMTKNTMYAIVSCQQVHPLFLAETRQGYLMASETCAFSMFGAEHVESLEAGSMVIFRKEGITRRQMDFGNAYPCSMECVYYGREDSLYAGSSIHKLRQKAGELLARDEDVEADIVIGVPDTANAAAAAFARAIHKPLELGLIKNRYIGSTFITPTREQRDSGMRVRLNAISSIVKGKRIYLVDDSIQKGSTAKRICQLLKEAGAKEVHIRIASPKIKNPCVYGVEYIEKDQLSAGMYTTEEMKELFDADSLRFLKTEDFESLLPVRSCMACMDGMYPIDTRDYKPLIQERKEV